MFVWRSSCGKHVSWPAAKQKQQLRSVLFPQAGKAHRNYGTAAVLARFLLLGMASKIVDASVHPLQTRPFFGGCISGHGTRDCAGQVIELQLLNCCSLFSPRRHGRVLLPTLKKCGRIPMEAKRTRMRTETWAHLQTVSFEQREGPYTRQREQEKWKH